MWNEKQVRNQHCEMQLAWTEQEAATDNCKKAAK